MKHAPWRDQLMANRDDGCVHDGACAVSWRLGDMPSAAMQAKRRRRPMAAVTSAESSVNQRKLHICARHVFSIRLRNQWYISLPLRWLRQSDGCMSESIGVMKEATRS